MAPSQLKPCSRPAPHLSTRFARFSRLERDAPRFNCAGPHLESASGRKLTLAPTPINSHVGIGTQALSMRCRLDFPSDGSLGLLLSSGANARQVSPDAACLLGSLATLNSWTCDSVPRISPSEKRTDSAVIRTRIGPLSALESRQIGALSGENRGAEILFFAIG